MLDHLVGREPELARLREFLAGSSRTLVLAGGPGIGKTALWEAGIGEARALGLRVVVARPSGAEARHSFAGLIDLFDGIDMAGLPGPQRSALEAALLRAAPGEAPRQAIALGVLNKLRWLAPLVVAIDDLQWLDPASSEALAFAAPRLADDRVAFLLARRPGRRPPLERVLEGRPLERLEVGPLGLDDTRRLLAERLGLSVPRPLMRRIADTTLGNPLFALEIGRALAARGAAGGEIPLPDAVEDLLGIRVAALPDAQRRALLAVALGGDLRPDELSAVADAEDALDAGLLRAEAGRVRPTHPLLGAAARKHARSRERRELHLALAGAVAGEERRARHLALAARQPDAGLADTVAAAADGAAARGAAAEAVELAEHALRLTPADAARARRAPARARAPARDGGRAAARDGAAHARARRRCRPAARASAPGSCSPTAARCATYHDRRAHFERALAEAGADPALRAHALASMALSTAAEGVERIGEVEAWAQEALAAGAGPRVERLALRALGWARSLSGRPIDDVCERFTAASPGAVQLVDSPEPVAALRLVWRGDLERARATLTRFLELADERDESVSYAWMRLNLCELGLRAADWGTVSRLLDEWAESADDELLITPTYQRCRALVAAGRGLAGRGAALGDAGARGGGADRLPLAGARVPPRSRHRGAARPRAERGGRAPARGLGPHAARGRRRAGRVPGRAGPGRRARGARRARRGRGRDRAPARPRRAAGAPVGARGRRALRRRPAAPRRGGRRSRGRRTPSSSSACAATPPIPCSRSAAGSGGTGNGAAPAMRSSGRRPRSTRSARRAGRTRRARSSRASARGGRRRAAS